MTAKDIQRLPFVLAVIAFIVVSIVVLIVNAMIFIAMLYPLAPVAGLVAGLVTFVTARLGLHSIQKTPNISPGRAAFKGAIFGMGAVMVITLLATLPLGEALDNYFFHLIVIFIFGGFLAPLIGSITAHKVAKAQTAHQTTSDAPA